MLRKMCLVALLFGLSCPLGAQTVRVVTEEYPPYNYTNSQGQLVGVSTEIVRAVLKRAGLSYHITSYAWSRAFQIALSQPNVLIYSIIRTEEREEQFKWVGVMMPASGSLYRLASRDDIQVSQPSDLVHYRIGAVRGDSRNRYLREIGVRPEMAGSFKANLKKLLAGRIDMFAIGQFSLVFLCRELGVDPSLFEAMMPLNERVVDVYMAFSKSTPDALVERVRKALNELREDGRIDTILAGYLGGQEWQPGGQRDQRGE